LKNISFLLSLLKKQLLALFFLNLVVVVVDAVSLAALIPLMFALFDISANVNEQLLGIIENIGKPMAVFWVMLLFIAKGLLMFFEERTYNKYLNRVLVDIKLRLLKVVDGFSYNEVINQSNGYINSILQVDVERLFIGLRSVLQFYRLLVLTFIYVSLVFYLSPMMFFAFVFMASLFLLPLGMLAKSVGNSSENQTKSNVSLNSVLIQYVGFTKYLRISKLSKKVWDKLVFKIGEVETNRTEANNKSSMLLASRDVMVVSVLLSVLFINKVWIQVEAGLILFLLVLLYRASSSAMQIQGTIANISTVQGSLTNIFNLLNREPGSNTDTPTKEDYSVIIDDRIKEGLQIKELTYGFDGKVLLEQVHVDLHFGNIYMLTGESGSGKTTLLNIIGGLIDTVNTNLYWVLNKPRTIKFGCVTQEPVVFDDTIWNNVTMWDIGSVENIEKFELAIRKAALFDVFSNDDLSENSLYVLRQNGSNLSGGQRQRVALAREFYREPDVFIFDEATNALDDETQSLIFNTIKELARQNKLIIFSSHDNRLRQICDFTINIKNKQVILS